MTTKIDLVLSQGKVFVWNADDWLTLRKDHRIIGELIGPLPKKPRQHELGIPLLLLPEEVTLLLEKKIARLVKDPSNQQPNGFMKKAFENYRELLFVQQQESLVEERKKQVRSLMDKIVEGKKRKILGINTTKKQMKIPLGETAQEAMNNVEVDEQLLFNEEMAKLPKLGKQNTLIQTHTVSPWINKEDLETAEWGYPVNSNEQLKYRTYKDLWEKGYYISNADKFGGDFLVYPGDPIIFHSQFIIHCKSRDESISIPELVGQCRIACNVRKTHVFAMFSTNQEGVDYQSFQWTESSLI